MNLFSFTIDGFRITQLIIAVFVFLFSMIFAKGYFKDTGEKNLKRFYVVTAITLLSVIGIFLSESLFTLFIFFEIMSISSYFWLINKDKKVSNFYLAISIISGMIMLMGLFILNNELGTLEISKISVNEYTNWLYIGGALTLVGFCTKAGMYPLHVWLADTYYHAPAPATAMLSSVLSKAGVFGVILVSSNIFMKNENFGKVLLIFSLITMIWGGLCALVSGDMKKTIAYSSMSQIGFIMFGISMQCILTEHNIIAARGTALHIINHSVFKLVLFTLCGIVLMKFKTTQLSKLLGIGRENKVFAFSFIISATGLMGVPFISSGYISKTLLHESVVEQIHLSHLPIYTMYEYLFLFAGGLTVCYLLKISMVIFAKGEKNQTFKMSPVTNVVLIGLSIFALVCGILPNMTIDKIADYTTPIMNQGEMHETINYFTWTNLQGSVISILCGVVLYFAICRPIISKTKGENIIPNVFTIKNIYTRLFSKDIPFILGAVCTFIDTYLVNFLLLVLIKIIEVYAVITARLAEICAEIMIVLGFRPLKEKDPNDRTPKSYKLGQGVDKVLTKLRIKTKRPIADTLSDFEAHSAIRRRMISASLSYGLFFAGVGLVGVLVYMTLS